MPSYSVRFVVAASMILATTACGGGQEATTPNTTTTDSTETKEQTPATVLTPPKDTTNPGTRAAESDDGRRLTATDDGADIDLRIGDTATLIQKDPSSPDPTVEGDAILLIEVANIAASGNRQWELRAVEVGEATIKGKDPPSEFTIAITVTE